VPIMLESIIALLIGSVLNFDPNMLR